MQQQKMILQKQRDFSEKISATFEFLRKNFKPLLGSIILIGGPFIVIIAFAQTYLALESLEHTKVGISFTESLDNTWSVTIIGYISGWFIFHIINLIVFSYFKIYHKLPVSEKITTDLVWKESKAQIIPITVAFLGTGLVLLFFLLTGYISYSIVLLLAIPYLAFIIYTSLVNTIIIFEEKSFPKAFSKSFKMINGNFWATFGLLFVIGLITLIISGIFSLPVAILSAIWGFNSVETLQSSGEMIPIDTTTTFGIIFVITNVIANLASNIISVIPNISVAFQYFSLKEKSESTGLLEQIAQMGDDVADDDESY